MVYRDFKDMARRADSDRVLCDKAFNIGKNLQYDEYQRSFASMVYKFFDKKSSSNSGFAIKQNQQQLAEELNKPIIRKLKKRQVYSHHFIIIFAMLILQIYN